jgi:thiol:disulfide interchange protein
MLRNVVRSVLGLVLVAAATWLANYLTVMMFGEEESETRA